MRNPEFVDTYSDDIIYLRQGRRALLTHPLLGTVKGLCDASYCRLFIVFMVGSLEAAIQQWKDRDALGILAPYFGKGNNEKRIDALFQAFTSRGIQVDREVFDDYLAIKYLRNAIVHARWKESEREWVTQRGFPSDSRKLTGDHWTRIQSVNENLLYYFFLPTVVDQGTSPARSLGEISNQRTDDTGIIRLWQMPLIYWRNLERLKSTLSDTMAGITIEGRHVEGVRLVKNPEIETEWRLYYLALRKAAFENKERFQEHRDVIAEAIACWNEYWRLTFERQGVSKIDLADALPVLESLHKTQSQEGTPALAETCGGLEYLSEKRVARALEVGRLAHALMQNISAVGLFTVTLPISDPDNTDAYLAVAATALLAMKVHHYWYSLIEGREPDSQAFKLYENLISDFQI